MAIDTTLRTRRSLLAGTVGGVAALLYGALCPALARADDGDVVHVGNELTASRLTRIYLTSAADWEVVAHVHGRTFGSVRPANTTTVVAALVDPRWKVEFEAEAVIGSGPGASS